MSNIEEPLIILISVRNKSKAKKAAGFIDSAFNRLIKRKPHALAGSQ